MIEDVHWADESTCDFLRYLARSLEDERLSLVATFRSDELPPEHPVRALVAELSRCDPVLHVELDRLTRAQTAEQLAAIAGRPVGESELDEIQDACTGQSVPHRGAVGDALDGDPGDARRHAPRPRADAARGGPAGPPPARGVRPPGGIELVAAAADDEAATTAALRRAVGEHILMPTDGGRRLAFRHALVREALYAELLPGEREELHRAVLEALHARRRRRGRARLPPPRGRPGQMRRWPPRSRPGSTTPPAPRIPEALEQFERALELWDAVEPADPPLDRLGVYREAAEAARLTGEYERAVEHCRMALQRLDVDEDPVRAAGFFERLSRYQSWDVERSLEGLDRALALLGSEPSAERARVLTGQSLQLSLLGRWTEARERRGDGARGRGRGAGRRGGVLGAHGARPGARVRGRAGRGRAPPAEGAGTRRRAGRARGGRARVHVPRRARAPARPDRRGAGGHARGPGARNGARGRRVVGSVPGGAIGRRPAAARPLGRTRRAARGDEGRQRGPAGRGGVAARRGAARAWRAATSRAPPRCSSDRASAPCAA